MTLMNLGQNKHAVERAINSMSLNELCAELERIKAEWGSIGPFDHEFPDAAAFRRDTQSWQMAQLRRAIADRAAA